MIAPQSIDPSDRFMAFEGKDVISEDTSNNHTNYQKELGRELSVTSISVNVNLLNLTKDNNISVAGITMAFDASSNYWHIDTSDLVNDTHIGQKFVGSITENGTTNHMRLISLEEFTVDDKALEKTLMTQGYSIENDSGTLKFIWKDASNVATYKADAYTTGISGSIPATNPAEITHRGPVIKA